MKTFNEIYNDIIKAIVEQPTISKSVSVPKDHMYYKYLNWVFEERYKVCPHPMCRRKFKSWRGTRIHMAKAHGWTKEKAAEATKDYYLEHLRE